MRKTTDEAADANPKRTEREDHIARIRTAHDAISQQEDGLLTDAARADADSPPNRVLKRRGRPPQALTKEKVPIRLDRDVVAYFRSTGAGWQTRINGVLRKAAGLK
jgi:uncharacterized protein (DUF4415 family)